MKYHNFNDVNDSLNSIFIIGNKINHFTAGAAHLLT